MQRWEYRVVSLREGHYTETLNEYGRDGWELVSVTSNPPEIPAPNTGSGLPVPRVFGQIGDAASKLNKLSASDKAEAAPTSTLLWVLRRPLDDE